MYDEKIIEKLRTQLKQTKRG